MSMDPANLIRLTFTAGLDGSPIPDRALIEVDAVALAWIGQHCGQFSELTNPGGETSHFYDVACEVWNRFDDDGVDGVRMSPRVAIDLASRSLEIAETDRRAI